MKSLYLGLAGALCACAITAPADGEGQAAAAHSGHVAPGKAVVTPIVRTAATISGQPLRLPQGASEMAAAFVDIPAGGAIMIHKHPWSRFVYVESGTLQVTNHATGASKDFPAGTVLAEVVEQWHEGRAVGGTPVRVVVIDVVPPGVNNSVMQAPPTP